jgi:hypothetical protein
VSIAAALQIELKKIGWKVKNIVSLKTGLGGFTGLLGSQKSLVLG